MGKITFLLDAFVGLIVCVIGFILLSTVLREKLVSLSADIGNILQALIK